MSIQQNLRALIDLLDLLSNEQLALKNKLESERFNTLIRQVYNPQSGILGDSMQNLIKNTLSNRFKFAVKEIEGKIKTESMDFVDSLVGNVKVHTTKGEIGLLDVLPFRGLVDEGLRLLSTVITSIFGKNKRRLQKVGQAIQKASLKVVDELEEHFLFLDNLAATDNDFSLSLKSINTNLATIESSLFDSTEALISLFRKIDPSLELEDDADLNTRVNKLVDFAEKEILNNEERMQEIESNFSNFLFFVSTNLISIKSRLTNSWKGFKNSKVTFQDKLITEVKQFDKADKEKKASFLEKVESDSKKLLQNLSTQIENIDEDLTRKVKLIRF